MFEHNQQIITLATDFISFKYRVISHLDKIKNNPNLVWEGLEIRELEDGEIIQVDNIADDKIIGTITFHRKDSGDVILFLVQIRDVKGNLKQPQRVCINIGRTNKIENNLRVPNTDETKVLNDMFTKVKNRVYGIKEKNSTPKKKKLARTKGRNNFDEE